VYFNVENIKDSHFLGAAEEQEMLDFVPMKTYHIFFDMA
jgi:hypothetical protein